MPTFNSQQWGQTDTATSPPLLQQFPEEYLKSFLNDLGGFEGNIIQQVDSFTGLETNFVDTSRIPDGSYSVIVYKNRILLYLGIDYFYDGGRVTFGVLLVPSDMILLKYGI